MFQMADYILDILLMIFWFNYDECSAVDATWLIPLVVEVV